MDLHARKITFVQEFLKIQNEKVISRLEKLLEKEKEKIAVNDFTPMNLDELNQRMDKSLLDSRNGRLTRNDDLTTEIKKWS
jgi:hypothetical protein